MAFTGDLEHLPIVDLIQLLNSTRKTGVLTVTGRKGESQLVFKDGYIVSASHLNNSVRIGDVLIEMKLLTESHIEAGLKRQHADGANRRPLAITLIEMGLVKEQDAYKALQQLIEMTVVEILTWKSGKFTLTHLKEAVDCDFRYYPEKMDHEVNINTQSILMDALRIFDEKMRDGLISDEPEGPAESAAGLEGISEDDLGLSGLDAEGAVFHKSFKGVAVLDPVAQQRAKLSELALDLPLSDIDRIASFLAGYQKKENGADAPARQAVILYSCDRLLSYGIETALAAAGIRMVTVSSLEEAGKAVSSAANGVGWLLIDAPVDGSQSFGVEKIAAVRSGFTAKLPKVRIIQLASPYDVRFAFNAYNTGATAIVPKPSKEQAGDFIDDFIALVGLLENYIRR